MQETHFTSPQELYAHYQAVAKRLRNKHYMYPVTPIVTAVTRSPVAAVVETKTDAVAKPQCVFEIEASCIAESEASVVEYSLEDFMRKVVAGLIPKSRKAAERLIELVAMKHDVSYGELIGSARTGPLVRARREAYWWLYNRFGFSLQEVGRVLRKDHTSVLHGLRMYKEIPE